MNRRAFILSSCAGFLVLNRVGAQTSDLSDAAIRDILRHRVDVKKYATGMAVGIIKNGHRSVIVYGKLDAGDVLPVAENTLFEIGSVTKVFTALLLADMVIHKELKSDDPVNLYLPDGVVTPERNGRAITLADLATHTSGLPSFPFSLISTPNPFTAMAHFTIGDLRSWLTNQILQRDPGIQWEYSNVGYCLLGLALANKAGMTYEALLNHRIIEPLKLNDTTLYPDASAIRRLAIGHDAKLAPIPPVELGIFAPAGALRSTVKDMLSFLNALLPGSHSPLEASAKVLMSIHRPAPAAGGEQALGWDLVSGSDPFLVKDGVTEGQAATIVLDVSRRTGVVVLSNAFPVNLGPPPGGGVGAADLARHLIRTALPLG